LRVIAAEMVGLAGHWSEAADLPEYPLHDLVAAPHVAGHELAALLGQIHENSARLKELKRLAARPIGVDDRRDLVVRIDRQVFRLHLIALADVDRMHLVGHTDLFQHNRNFFPVRSAPSIELNHVSSSQCLFCDCTMRLLPNTINIETTKHASEIRRCARMPTRPDRNRETLQILSL
jgi:hypothetical protein